jgi:membrane associated rhomboid family serine protease
LASRVWFLYQLIDANLGLFSTSANGGGVAFFAYVGGFLFGLGLRGYWPEPGRPRPRRDSLPALPALRG